MKCTWCHTRRIVLWETCARCWAIHALLVALGIAGVIWILGLIATMEGP